MFFQAKNILKNHCNYISKTSVQLTCRESTNLFIGKVASGDQFISQFLGDVLKVHNIWLLFRHNRDEDNMFLCFLCFERT
jgi:hypothetical protein